ncbi:MAG TPA: hypothetical protein VGB51_05220 [Actinomycetota bacterium]
MAALGLPIALLAGLLAELAAGAVRRRPFGVLREAWVEARALLRGEARPSLLEVGGLLAALLGSGLVATAAIRGRPGSVAFVYLALVLAAVGAQTAADPLTGERRAARERLAAVAAEPAFLVALGASFLRWGAKDIDAVRGAHEVLGSAFAVGPPAAAAGAILAAVVLVVAGAIRLPRAPGNDDLPAAEERSSEEGAEMSFVNLPPRLIVRLACWAAAGATALVAGSLVAGGEGGPELLLSAGAAVGAAAVLGASRELLRGRGLLAAPVLAVAAAGAAYLVTTA